VVLNIVSHRLTLVNVGMNNNANNANNANTNANATKTLCLRCGFEKCLCGWRCYATYKPQVPSVASKEFHDFVVEWGGAAFTDFASDQKKLVAGFRQHFGLIWSADQINDLMETYLDIPDEERIDYD